MTRKEPPERVNSLVDMISALVIDNEMKVY